MSKTPQSRQAKDGKLVVSLRAFLKTGELGPLKPTLTLMEVAQALGVPDGWFTNSGAAVPIYWAYEHLEVSFHFHPPYNMDFFQLEHARYLTGEGDFLGDRMRLTLDGLSGEMTPSALLRARIWRAADVTVTINLGGNSLTLTVGGVIVIYRLDRQHGNDAQDAMAAMEAASADGKLIMLAALCDANAEQDSIYSYPPRPQSDWVKPATGFHEMTGERYLSLLRSTGVKATSDRG